MQICSDTRKPLKGAIFFALKGPNFNANSFAEQALAGGCAAAVVDDPQYAEAEGTVYVNNVLESLQNLARHHRRQFNIPVFAITGSNAKTTTKELMHAVISKKYNCLATEGNLNNHLGVPFTLLKLRSEHQFAIIEMGANHQGEIALLCGIAEPGYGLITNIGKAHLEGFGGIEGVKKGKGELYRYLEDNNGTIILNGDDATLGSITGSTAKFTYGATKRFDVMGRDCTAADTVSFKFTSRYGEHNWDLLPLIETKMTGGYNFINCLAAVAVGMYFKVPEPDIISGISSYSPQMNRSQLLNTANNTILLDAYNANPDSMVVAIENFEKHHASKKMLLLGDMFELGEYSGAEHKKIVDLLAEKGFQNVYLVGREFQKVAGNRFRTFESTEACKKFLQLNIVSGYTVLIKGSRSMKMESLREAL